VPIEGDFPGQIPADLRPRLAVLAVELSRVQGPSLFGEGPALRGAAVKLAIALGALPEEKSHEYLLDLLGGDWSERLWVAHAIVARGGGEESQLLIGLLQDQVPDVRATAAGALARLLGNGHGDDLLAKALRRALTDPGVSVAWEVPVRSTSRP
jgi:HEAT repeat protein